MNTCARHLLNIIHLEVSLSGRLHAKCTYSYGVSILEKLFSMYTDSRALLSPLLEPLLLTYASTAFTSGSVSFFADECAPLRCIIMISGRRIPRIYIAGH